MTVLPSANPCDLNWRTKHTKSRLWMNIFECYCWKLNMQYLQWYPLPRMIPNEISHQFQNEISPSLGRAERSDFNRMGITFSVLVFDIYCMLSIQSTGSIQQIWSKKIFFVYFWYTIASKLYFFIENVFLKGSSGFYHFGTTLYYQGYST